MVQALPAQRQRGTTPTNTTTTTTTTTSSSSRQKQSQKRCSNRRLATIAFTAVALMATVVQYESFPDLSSLVSDYAVQVSSVLPSAAAGAASAANRKTSNLSSYKQFSLFATEQTDGDDDDETAVHIVAMTDGDQEEAIINNVEGQQPLQSLSKSIPSASTTTTTTTTTTPTTSNSARTTKAFTWDLHPQEEDSIRSWGCARRQEAPLIFVHNGKAGGGSIRARLAASALDYNRTKWANAKNDPTYYYYPMNENQRGSFVNSGFFNFRPSYPKTADNFTKKVQEKADRRWKSFEKTLPCSATTPLGQAIACPLVETSPLIQQSCSGSRCNLVYAGHNLLGSELHWLPSEYLSNWWESTPWYDNRATSSGDITNNGNDGIGRRWRERATRWLQQPKNPDSPCHYQEGQPYHFYRDHYFECVAPYEDEIDQAATLAVRDQLPKDGNGLIEDWSPIYASLPVLRVTMLREPFSWLVSKFFWHQGMQNRMMGRDGEFVALDTCDMDGNNFEAISEWVGPAAVKHMNHLCGEDCVVRMKAGHMTLGQLERQARHNLQRAFAVVGLLNETDTFYDMITARAAYMNTSLNPHVTGSKHSSSKKKEYERCSELYQTGEFQMKLLAVCPELVALRRLYQVGTQVNRFQLQEMRSCGLLPSIHHIA